MEDVSHEQQLFATEWLWVASIDAQHLVDEINNVRAYHTDLIDDDELHFAYQLPLGASVLQRLLDVAAVVARVVGKQGMEGQSEETVQGGASGVDGCDARGCEDHVLLLRVLRDVSQECAFTRSSLPRQEERTAREVHNLQGILPLLIVEIEFMLFHSDTLAMCR